MPLMSAMTNLAARMRPMVAGATDELTKIGIISSEVERNTANSVPAVITPPEYRLAAPAENPHCGRSPIPAPSTCPNLFTRERTSTDWSSVLRSSHSIPRYVIKRNGISVTVSFMVSIIESTNTAMPPL